MNTLDHPETWTAVRRVDSANPCVSKYVFEKSDAVAEAVLYGYPDHATRTVICCSTQSGCPVGCRFCGAGDSFVRSLTHEEIVAQVVHLLADRALDADRIGRLQIMFMSMGEPLLNQRALVTAIYRLFGLYPHAALLVSTSAPRVDYRELIAASREIPNVGLQFSIHESTDERRNALIPFEAKLSLSEIAELGERWHRFTGRKPFFNYCAHEGNVSAEDTTRLVDLFDPKVWEATISVVCERAENQSAANARQRDLALGMERRLRMYGFSTRCFDPAGQDDIGGGCGQLWFVQDWMRTNASLAKPSVGRGLPVVHAPSDAPSDGPCS